MSRALVALIKAELEAKGQTWTTNEDAFQITARVAWAMRHQGAQLVMKRPEQNGADWHGARYSHDAIAFPDGWIDCLASAGPPANENRPVWDLTGRSTAALVDPFDLDAAPDPKPDPDPDPDPQPIGLIARLDAMERALAMLLTDFDLIGVQQEQILTKQDQILAKQDRALRGPFGWTFRP
jgi:hypothetical protein